MTQRARGLVLSLQCGAMVAILFLAGACALTRSLLPPEPPPLDDARTQIEAVRAGLDESWSELDGRLAVIEESASQLFGSFDQGVLEAALAIDDDVSVVGGIQDIEAGGGVPPALEGFLSDASYDGRVELQSAREAARVMLQELSDVIPVGLERTIAEVPGYLADLTNAAGIIASNARLAEVNGYWAKADAASIGAEAAELELQLDAVRTQVKEVKAKASEYRLRVKALTNQLRGSG